jgi:DNA adenine methylase
MIFPIKMCVLSRPLLRYHGGKWRIGKWILSHFPDHKVYVEPFGGGASVLLQKPRAKAEIYNDLDSDVVNLFRVLRDEEQSRQLVSRLSLTPFARGEFEDSLQESDTEHSVERARKLIVRSFMGFSTSGFRSGIPTGFRNRSFRGLGGAPSYDWKNYPDALLKIIERLRGVCIEQKDALELIPLLDTPDTLFYVDPPYLETTRVYLESYKHELGKNGHEKLSEILHNLKGMVVLSGYRSDLYDDLYADWLCKEKKISCEGGSRLECLWLSPNLTFKKSKGTLFFPGWEEPF